MPGISFRMLQSIRRDMFRHAYTGDHMTVAEARQEEQKTDHPAPAGRSQSVQRHLAGCLESDCRLH